MAINSGVEQIRIWTPNGVYTRPVNGTSVPMAAQQPVTVPQTQGDQFEMTSKVISGETCTDGSDDGKIGLGSKIWNTIKGAGKGLLNMVKGAIKNPIKTIAMVGLCCIPVVGPIIGGGLAAYGVYSGAKTIVNGVKAANSATSDAEAKLAWQNIGNGTFTTAASLVALKGSAGVLKNQLTGGSSAVTAFRNGDSWGNIARAAAKDTVANATNLVKGVGSKVRDGYGKIRDGYNYVRQHGVGGTIRNLASNGIGKVRSGLDGLQNKVDTYQSPAQVRANAKGLATQAKLDGATVETYSSGVPKKITYQDGTVIEFSRAGNVVQQTTITGTTKAGQTTQATIDNYRNNTTTTVDMVGSTGRIKGYTQTNNATGTSYHTTSESYFGRPATVKTTYTFTDAAGNSSTFNASQLDPLTRAALRLDSGSLGTITSAQLPVSDTTLLYGTVFLNEGEEIK